MGVGVNCRRPAINSQRRGPDVGIAAINSAESTEARSGLDSARNMDREPGRQHEDSGYLSLGVDELQEDPGQCPERDRYTGELEGKALSLGEASGRDAAVVRSPSPLRSRACASPSPAPSALRRPDFLSFSFPGTKPTEVSGTATSAAVEEESGSEPELGAAAAAAAAAEEEQGQAGAGAPDPMVDEIQKGGGGGGDGDEEEFPQEPVQADAEDPQPSDGEARLHRCSFRRLQLTELESVFQRSQYPNVFAR